jgi:hypothetical protein
VSRAHASGNVALDLPHRQARQKIQPVPIFFFLIPCRYGAGAFNRAHLPSPAPVALERAGSASRTSVEGWAPHWQSECGLSKADVEHCSRSRVSDTFAQDLLPTSGLGRDFHSRVVGYRCSSLFYLTGAVRVLSTARFLPISLPRCGSGRGGSASRNGAKGWVPHWLKGCALRKADAEHCSSGAYAKRNGRASCAGEQT